MSEAAGQVADIEPWTAEQARSIEDVERILAPDSERDRQRDKVEEIQAFAEPRRGPEHRDHAEGERGDDADRAAHARGRDDDDADDRDERDGRRERPVALERLRGRFRQVLVVTHDAAIKEQLPNAVEVVKLAGRRATARPLIG